MFFLVSWAGTALAVAWATARGHPGVPRLRIPVGGLGRRRTGADARTPASADAVAVPETGRDRVGPGDVRPRARHGPIRKRPQVRGWQRKAPGDGLTMYRYLANFRGCNVGPLMGREIRPGEYALALDVDTRHRGAESLRRPLKGRRIRLPRTATARTGGGGWHVLLTSPFPARSKTGAFGPDYPGLDLKGVGGYIVAAPSIHPITGRAYRWIRHPYQGIAPAPKRFLAGRVGEAGIGVRRPSDDVQFAVRLPRPGGALMPARPAAASPSMRKSNDARSTAPDASDCSSCSNAG